MALLSAHKLGKSFGGRTLFSDISFEVTAKDHIGLVGANGTGKTTLFHILLGTMKPDEGEVHRQKLLRVGHLEQAPAVCAGQTLYSLTLEIFAQLMRLEAELNQINAALLQPGANFAALANKQAQLQESYEQQGGLTYQSRTRSTLLGLGFGEEDLQKPATALSGGQLNKAMLARVLLNGADVLLLDEPTNHLDMQAVEWLENYLKGYPGAYIVISHDRYFLDQATNRMLELSNTKLFSSRGNYSAHIEQRESEQEIIQRHYRNTQKEIRRIYSIVEQQRRWNRERNIRMAESKLKQIDKLKATLVEPEKEKEGIRFAFTSRQPGGNDVLIAEGLKKAYGADKLFENTSLHIRAGERVCLLGPNGCGKTTLLRLLMGRETPDSGSSYFGTGVEPAYYEQNMRSLLPDNTVLQEVWDAYPRMNRPQVHNALAAFLFRAGDADKRVEVLSGGERARVQLLKLMLSGANLLLLDEPTNHLDIASREALERALEEYDGAILLVTHDRYLVNRIADRVLYMRPDGLVETIGGYDEFMAWVAQGGEIDDEIEPEKPKNDYQLKKERQGALARAKTALKRAEEAVATTEAEISALEQRLSLPEIACDYQEAVRLAAELEQTRKALEAQYTQWEQADAQCTALFGEE